VRAWWFGKRAHEEIGLRKFIIREMKAVEEGDNGNPLRQIRQNDDFASMREAVTRRYRRLQEEKKEFPGLILIDGASEASRAQALESLQIINQPSRASRKGGDSLRAGPGR